MDVTQRLSDGTVRREILAEQTFNVKMCITVVEAVESARKKKTTQKNYFKLKICSHITNGFSCFFLNIDQFSR